MSQTCAFASGALSAFLLKYPKLVEATRTGAGLRWVSLNHPSVGAMSWFETIPEER